MKRKLTGADKQYQDEVKLGIATFELTRPRNPPGQKATRTDRLTVNGVDYDLSPVVAEGLFSCYQNLKKKVGRPKGVATRFPGIKAFSAELGVTPLHVYMVLTGQRKSRRVTLAWNGRSPAV